MCFSLTTLTYTKFSLQVSCNDIDVVMPRFNPTSSNDENILESHEHSCDCHTSRAQQGTSRTRKVICSCALKRQSSGCPLTASASLAWHADSSAQCSAKQIQLKISFRTVQTEWSPASHPTSVLYFIYPVGIQEAVHPDSLNRL